MPIASAERRSSGFASVLVGLVLASMSVSGCASSGALTPWRSSANVHDAREGMVSPWLLDPASMPSQHLYRVQYEGPEGELGFKLILYIERPDRFRFQAADTLGRRLWVLRVGDGRRALWIDHRQEAYCWADATTGLDFIPLSRMPVAAFPRLLLGRMPAEPAMDLRETDDRLSYFDALGRAWVGTLVDGAPSTWSLLEGDEPVAWWRRTGEPAGRPGAIFSDRRGRQQVRWREVIAEPLVDGIATDPIPPSYREVVCGAA